MNTTRRVGGVLLGPIVVFAAALVVSQPKLASRTLAKACPFDEAAEWVYLNRANLPSTLEEIETFDMVYRRAIYAVLPAGTREVLWNANLDRFVGRHPELIPTQIKFIRDVQSKLASFLSFSQEDERLQALTSRSREILGDRLALEAFARLGDPSTPTMPNDSEELTEECECAEASDWCLSINIDCIFGECERTTGCGTLWMFVCDGMCELNPE